MSHVTLCTNHVTHTESRFKAKHSLDSDEEDDVDDTEQGGLDDEDLGAQEETTIVSHTHPRHPV